MRNHNQLGGGADRGVGEIYRRRPFTWLFLQPHLLKKSEKYGLNEFHDYLHEKKAR